jgi:hypothetical protein
MYVDSTGEIARVAYCLTDEPQDVQTIATKARMGPVQCLEILRILQGEGAAHTDVAYGQGKYRLRDNTTWRKPRRDEQGYYD